jgi:hypothetical protein
MTTRSFKLMIPALSIAVMLASSADAGTATKKHKPHQPMAGTSLACRGASNFRCGAVYNGNDYLGDDPDSFVRLMIQRDLGANTAGRNRLCRALRTFSQCSTELQRLGLSGVECTAATSAESLHEAVADQRRIAHGLRLARLIVDLGRQQNRFAIVEAAFDQRVEMRVIAHPFAVGDADAARPPRCR